MNFESKNIIIIGGSSGIGRGIASSFIDKGANVCITGTRENIEDYEEDITENIKKCIYRNLIFQMIKIYRTSLFLLRMFIPWFAHKELLPMTVKSLKWIPLREL